MASVTAVKPRRTSLELLTGVLVLGLLGLMLVAAVVGEGRKTDTTGYRLHAGFSHIDGLGVGSDVRLAGVTVGQVVSEHVNPATYKAEVTFTVRPDIKLPTDSAAIITSDSLLGGKYIALSPGGDDHTMAPDATISETQGSISLEQLLSKFIFSVTDTLTRANKDAAGAKAPATGDAGKADLP
ncbi:MULTISPECIES: outer membrane lipid asymmetry maintenance protein MlaD [Acetobacter]|uniref:Outer membrane lipid asymmetry maintenance protein MlaD n=1 Tax=Acetobacter persici TaxID=1076596 RepID=A0A1U9LEB0_9PROT|nr:MULTISPECIES: outer membrane lipid asymmetry maintenance protein MlaD [Acetobacter]AQT04698.1 outer membrane lipid asymmetry maintenance protein MlaD [Acetobacter persici]MBS0964274.1 outer membrane lipid asymmetry maintenance protein MlaD [Acetobacter persici]MBS1014931.1 outer membrane lipid asymmetry maintenance protein MlaD [Acetobacter persici]MCG0996900.1 outer membrane lipid asymmetry maintenance protein MlaD [Acetobacter persici]MCP9320398.1 outer membrane lipid asymmetry maintenanc